MGGLSEDAIYLQLRGLDFAEDVARRRAREEANRRATGEQLTRIPPDPRRVPKLAPELPPIHWPVRLLLPWSHLCSDDNRFVARIAGTMEKPYPKLNLTSEYRQAQNAT